MRGLIFIVAAVLVLPAQALELNGSFTQGGLVVGKVVPGSTVRLNGEFINVAGNGAFVFGFARDAKPRALLSVTEPGKARQTRELKITPQKYDIQRIDGLPTRKVTPNPADVARIKEDNVKIWGVRDSMTPETRFLSGFTWPVLGRISGVYGSQRILNGKPKNPHNGVDVAAPPGTEIVAPADGIVVLVHQDMFYTGKTLMIDHGLGLTSVYAHMKDIFVVEGQLVDQGQRIGSIGQTGRATGPHLHWGMTWKGVHLDPMLVTGPMPEQQAKN